MKKILIVLFGVSVFQGSVWADANAMLAILTHKSAMLRA